MTLLWQYLKQHKKLLFGTLILATINQVFSLIDPQIFRIIIDRFATAPGTYSFNEFITGVLLLLAAAIGAAFVSRVAKNFQDYYVNVVTQKVGTSLYADAVTHSFSLPFAVFEDKRSGEVLQIMQKARNDLQMVITSMVNVAFLSLVGITFVVVYAFIVYWWVGLAYFLVIPLIAGTTYFISKKIKEAQKQIVAETASLAGSTTETLRNVELVKSLGLEEQETKRLNLVNDKILDLELKKVKLTRYLSFTQGTMVNAMRSAILFLMLWLIFRGGMSIGEFFTLWIYSFFVFSPLGELGNVISQYREADASMDQLSEILNIAPEEKPKQASMVDVIKEVEFKNVNFVYGEESGEVLKNIDLRVQSSESIALAGPSGSGKSTIVKLILGLYKPTSGEFMVNGIPAAKLDFENLRKKVGYVSQDTQLFAGTIRENLVFVNPTASDEDCLKALKSAEALSLIERGGKGLDTKIGEGGIKISGGEKQRLAIARALLRDPDLLIFDEATSSLDSITERAITQTIRKIAENRPNLMMVVVAHRLSTVSHADRIYVLEKGEIVEEGSHGKLLVNRNLYAALWRQQGGELPVMG